MHNEDHTSTASSHKRPGVLRGLAIAAAILLVSVLIFAIVVVRDDGRNAKLSSGDGQIATATTPEHTTTSIDLRTELVARLREILAKRESAYDKRDTDILRKIYTVDCPCLKSDSNAIRELVSEDYFWVGGKTSIDIRRLERVTPRMWIVIADFTSEALRIETESGRLVRAEPRGSDLFQFVLARPTGSTQWLLGQASSYESG